jgi:hypothetical protein
MLSTADETAAEKPSSESPEEKVASAKETTS